MSAITRTERLADGLWQLLRRHPLVGSCLWAAIGFELFGLATALDGLSQPTHTLLAQLSVKWGVGPTTSLIVLFLTIRLLSAHLLLNHMRVNRKTGQVLSPPMFSIDRPDMGRAVLLGLIVALLDAIVLRLATTQPSAAATGLLSGTVGVPRSAAVTAGLCALILGVQTGLICLVLWAVDVPLAEVIKQRIPASRPLLRTRDARKRLHLAGIFGGFIYFPIALGLLFSTPAHTYAFWVLGIFLLVQLATTAVTETTSLVIDWRNGQWIQSLGRRLAEKKQPGQRLPVVETMVKFGEFAGPVWPELPAALEDTVSLGALSARQLHLGVQLAIHLTEREWTDALGVGEIIVEWFPDSRLATIVREKEAYMRRKAGAASDGATMRREKV